MVAGFSASLPTAQVVVLDNASSDDTAQIARDAGALVQTVAQLGKGIAVRAGFESIDADVILLIDGDGTYDPADAPLVLAPVLENRADMVVGERLSLARGHAFKPLRHGANHLITFAVSRMFGRRYKDALSGYRAVTREFIHEAELNSAGFEIEIEMLAAARRLGARVVEVPVHYEARHTMSTSKLVPVRDAIRILSAAWRLRPRTRS
jgi:glycosyltransferase involved in cell wall biosynthesis